MTQTGRARTRRSYFFRSAITSLVPPVNRLLARWRRLRFRIDIKLHAGSALIAPSARFDHPTRFQGQGSVRLGEHVIMGYWMAGSRSMPILIQPREINSVIEIGRGTVIVNGTEMIARQRITVGEQCRIGARTTIIDADFHELDPELRDHPGAAAAVEIGNNVWFGNEVFVLKGVHIGQDAVIGARTVVTKDVPPGAIVVGNPGHVIGSVYKSLD